MHRRCDVDGEQMQWQQVTGGDGRVARRLLAQLLPTLSPLGMMQSLQVTCSPTGPVAPVNVLTFRFSSSHNTVLIDEPATKHKYLLGNLGQSIFFFSGAFCLHGICSRKIVRNSSQTKRFEWKREAITNNRQQIEMMASKPTECGSWDECMRSVNEMRFSIVVWTATDDRFHCLMFRFRFFRFFPVCFRFSLCCRQNNVKVMLNVFEMEHVLIVFQMAVLCERGFLRNCRGFYRFDVSCWGFGHMCAERNVFRDEFGLGDGHLHQSVHKIRSELWLFREGSLQDHQPSSSVYRSNQRPSKAINPVSLAASAQKEPAHSVFATNDRFWWPQVMSVDPKRNTAECAVVKCYF